MKKSVLSIFMACLFGLIFFSQYDALQESACLDSGKGVWDSEQKKCRQDCLKYGESFGCIKLLPNEVEIMKKCSHRQCVTAEMLKEICLRNNKAFDVKRHECDFDFALSDCFKNGEAWLYPDICEK